jgi:hypothetical protein
MLKNSLEFFLSIPDDLLVEIAVKDWESLEMLCIALTMDLQLLKEEKNENISNWGGMC